MLKQQQSIKNNEISIKNNPNAFSFNDESKLQPQAIEPSLRIPTQSDDGKIEIINFSQFKDDAGSISSIKSFN